LKEHSAPATGAAMKRMRRVIPSAQSRRQKAADSFRKATPSEPNYYTQANPPPIMCATTL